MCEWFAYCDNEPIGYEFIGALHQWFSICERCCKTVGIDPDIIEWPIKRDKWADDEFKGA